MTEFVEYEEPELIESGQWVGFWLVKGIAVASTIYNFCTTEKKAWQFYYDNIQDNSIEIPKEYRHE